MSLSFSEVLLLAKKRGSLIFWGDYVLKFVELMNKVKAYGKEFRISEKILSLSFNFRENDQNFRENDQNLENSQMLVPQTFLSLG